MAAQRGLLRLVIGAGTGAALIAGAAHFERDLDRREAASTSAVADQAQQTIPERSAAAPRARLSRGS